MSPEEWQVAIGEWARLLQAVNDDLWDAKKDEDTAPEIIDVLAKATNVTAKVLRDMDALMWSESDRDKAFTVIAGYVTQSNVERQARRDADLARHKAMLDDDYARRVREEVLRITENETRARTAAESNMLAAQHRASQAEDEVETYRAEIDERYVERVNDLTASIEARIEAAVHERLYGATDSATPGRRKRPLALG